MLRDKGLIVMLLPQFFLDNNSNHARYMIANKGVHIIHAFRLPDNLFPNAKITVDIIILQKGQKTVNWVKTVNSGINNHKINEYFINHPQHILGKLKVKRMYERWGLNCVSTGDLRDKLIKIYKNFK